MLLAAQKVSTVKSLGVMVITCLINRLHSDTVRLLFRVHVERLDGFDFSLSFNYDSFYLPNRFLDGAIATKTWVFIS
jgi:hypothetical protein